MNGKDMFLALNYVSAKFVDEAETVTKFQRERKPVSIRRPFLVAAIIALMLLLMGCAAAVYLVFAESPFTSLPLLAGEEIAYDDIQIQVLGSSPTGMAMMCTIDDPAFSRETPEESENSIFIINGPFYLERKTDNGWEELPKKIKDATWSDQTYRTGGTLDLYYTWGNVYGYLDPGTYRITTVVVEGQPEVQVEFDIEPPKNLSNAEAIQKCNDAFEAISDRKFYHVYVSQQAEYGPEPEGINVGDDSFSTEEFWKYENDYLYLFSRDGNTVNDGHMKKDGVKYRLDNETEGDSNTPIAGWSVWPALDDNRLAWWMVYQNPDAVTFPDGIGVITDQEITFQRIRQEWDTVTTTVSYFFDEVGNLTKYQEVTVDTKANGADVTATHTMIIEIKDTDPAVIAQKINEQDINFYREFNWAEDQKNKTPVDVAFHNTNPTPVTTAPEAIAQAINECTVDYTKIVVFRDEAAGMWKVQFQIVYGHQGYQYVYLNNDGITQMVANTGPKVWVQG